MPEVCVREMVADWAAAGRAITGRCEVASWYATHRDTIVLHPTTRAYVGWLIADHYPATDGTQPHGKARRAALRRYLRQ